MLGFANQGGTTIRSSLHSKGDFYFPRHSEACNASRGNPHSFWYYGLPRAFGTRNDVVKRNIVFSIL